MRVSHEIYRAAAESRLREAGVLHENCLFVSSHYLAGLSVECILLAYRLRQALPSDSFEGRHDLAQLLRSSGMDRLFRGRQESNFLASFGYVAKCWRNSHRFFSGPALRSHLVRIRLNYEVKRGDLLKENSRRMLTNATFIVAEGVERWNR